MHIFHRIVNFRASHFAYDRLLNIFCRFIPLSLVLSLAVSISFAVLVWILYIFLFGTVFASRDFVSGFEAFNTIHHRKSEWRAFILNSMPCKSAIRSWLQQFNCSIFRFRTISSMKLFLFVDFSPSFFYFRIFFFFSAWIALSICIWYLLNNTLFVWIFFAIFLERKLPQNNSYNLH